MDNLRLLIDLHKDGYRQGPGGDAETARALALANIRRDAPLKVADIGCGTGASTLVLAQALNAQIVAVDFLPAFLEVLSERARNAKLAENISTLACSMEALPFAPETLDIIWSEGAIYNMGFERGVRAWRQHLKPGGLLAVTEITWLTNDRPAALEAHWQREYPEIDVASAKIRTLEQHGFSPEGYFVLPEQCWLDGYYRPMQARFDDFLDRHGHSEQAQEIVRAEQTEIALYETNKSHIGYGFYMAKKLP